MIQEDNQQSGRSLFQCATVCLALHRYCGAMDSVLAGHVTDINNLEQKHRFHQFLSLSMSSGKYQVYVWKNGNKQRCMWY